jgi:hypothetical protein
VPSRDGFTPVGLMADESTASVPTSRLGRLEGASAGKEPTQSFHPPSGFFGAPAVRVKGSGQECPPNMVGVAINVLPL